MKDAPHHDENSNSLLDQYCLRDGGGATTTASSDKHKVYSPSSCPPPQKKARRNRQGYEGEKISYLVFLNLCVMTLKVIEGLGDAYISKDGKLVLDFLQALHEAERRQAEIDAHLFAEEKKHMKV